MAKFRCKPITLLPDIRLNGHSQTCMQWNGHYNAGFDDLAADMNDDSLPVATEALMFLIVPLNAVLIFVRCYDMRLIENGTELDTFCDTMTVCCRYYSVRYGAKTK